MAAQTLQPKQRIRIEQTIHVRDGNWVTKAAEGEVVSILDKPTGSWHAHGKDDKLWLNRLRLRRDDGELVDFVLDGDSRVTILKDAPVKG